MVILRFKDKSPREYEVPLNIRIRLRREKTPADRAEIALALNGTSKLPVSESIPADGVTPKPAIASDVGDRIDLPIGITMIFLILFSTAMVNLFTKKVATIWGIGFTFGFLLMFIVCEQVSHRLRKGGHHAHLEQFNEKVTDHPTPQSLGLAHANPVLVAIRNPRSMPVLNRVLQETDTTERDIVAITCKVLPPMTPGITQQELTVNDNDREVLTRVVTLAEEAGKQVVPLVIPTNNPLYAIATAARDLQAKEVVLGASEKSGTDVQLEQFAMAWGMAVAEQPTTQPLRIRIIGGRGEVAYDL
jgi:nucleotide-binding universal stress UspA family protein